MDLTLVQYPLATVQQFLSISGSGLKKVQVLVFDPIEEPQDRFQLPTSLPGMQNSLVIAHHSNLTRCYPDLVELSLADCPIHLAHQMIRASGSTLQEISFSGLNGRLTEYMPLPGLKGQPASNV